MKNTTAIILAAGSGSRMNSSLTKQRMDICGESVLHRSVRAFSQSTLVNEIIVTCREDEVDFCKNELLFDFPKVKKIVIGGKCRAESAANAFAHCSPDCDFVAIHDAARCLVTVEMIDSVIAKAHETEAATAARRATDTVKLSTDNVVESTLDRNLIFLASTPQIFSSSLYAKALANAEDLFAITDDNMLVEALGVKPAIVDVGSDNIKITTPDDIEYAEFLIKKRDKHMPEFRIGHGYDVHRFSEGRELILGGVKIPYERGLLGHSDADVLVHAVMDSLLGAAALGDIGRHFPDTDEKFRGISSLDLLKRVSVLLFENGYRINNIDVTLILQKPKIATYIEQMIDNISEVLDISRGRINIKATTEEKLGFTGSGEGAAAHAVSLLEKK